LAIIIALPIFKNIQSLNICIAADLSSKLVTLNEAIDMAFNMHEDPKVMFESIQKASIQKNKSFSFLMPSLYFEQSFTYLHPQINLSFPDIGTSSFLPDETWRRSLTLRQPIYEGEFYPSFRVGKEGIMLAKDQYAFTVKELLFSVTQDYYEVLKTKALVNVAIENLKLTAQTLKDAKERYKAGTVTKTDVLRAEVQKAEVEQMLVSAKNDLLAAKKLLGRMIGIKEYKTIETISPETFSDKLRTSKLPINKLFELAISQRDDLKARVQEVEVAKWARRQVSGRFHPMLSLDVSYLGIDPENPTETTDSYAVLFSITVPIFESGTRVFDLQTTARNIIQSRLSYERTKKDIEVEIVSSVLQIDTLRQNLKTLQKEVELSRESYDLTSKQYRVGVASSLDVQQTLTQLITTKNQLIMQTYDYEVSLLNLERSVGLFAKTYGKKFPKDVYTLTHKSVLHRLKED